jgi:hypothetical protein
MDAYTLQSIGICAAIFVGLCIVAYLCQKLEDYIDNNIINKQ